MRTKNSFLYQWLCTFASLWNRGLGKMAYYGRQRLQNFLGPSHTDFSWNRVSLSLRKQPFLLVPRRWGRFARRTFATQRQKFHTDDVNQCLHNKSGSHGVPNVILFDFTFLLVDFGKVLCSFTNELQQNSNASSRQDYIPQILTVLL